MSITLTCFSVRDALLHPTQTYPIILAFIFELPIIILVYYNTIESDCKNPTRLHV